MIIDKARLGPFTLKMCFHSSEKPGLVRGISTHGTGVGTRWSLNTFQPRAFCISVILFCYPEPRRSNKNRDMDKETHTYQFSGECFVVLVFLSLFA